MSFGLFFSLGVVVVLGALSLLRAQSSFCESLLASVIIGTFGLIGRLLFRFVAGARVSQMLFLSTCNSVIHVYTLTHSGGNAMGEIRQDETRGDKARRDDVRREATASREIRPSGVCCRARAYRLDCMCTREPTASSRGFLSFGVRAAPKSQFSFASVSCMSSHPSPHPRLSISSHPNPRHPFHIHDL